MDGLDAQNIVRIDQGKIRLNRFSEKKKIIPHLCETQPNFKSPALVGLEYEIMNRILTV